MESKKSHKIIIPRITQLDACEFDKEVHKILFNQVVEIINVLKPGALNKVKAELSLLLDLIIFKYSLIKNNATFGQDILGLKYDDSLTKVKAVLFAVIKYIFPYLKTKYEDNAGRIDNVMVSSIMNQIEIITKASHLINLVIFLKEGKYPTVTDRLLGLKYEPTQRFSRNVTYNFMVRQLMWHGFMELLTYVLPLINYKAIKRKVKMFFFSNSNNKRIKTYANYNVRTKCVICNDYPVLPCIISKYCSHVACYYCLKSNLLADQKFICPECDEPNTASEDQNFILNFFVE